MDHTQETRHREAGRPDLTGKRIAISRQPDEIGPLAGLLVPLGATLIAAPLIQIEPPGDPAPLAEAATHLSRYDWLAVTSAHAARALHAARPEGEPWPSALGVAAIGQGTARALAAAGIPVSLIPPEAHGAALVRALIAAAGRASTRKRPLAGQRILFPCSDIARRTVPDGLAAAGARVDEVEAYRTRPDRAQARILISLIERGGLDALILTSPSSAESLAGEAGDRWPDVLGAARLLSIGPTTSGRLAELGRPADVEAPCPEPSGILQAIRVALG